MAGANIRIGANSSDFQKQMKEVTNQLKLVTSECGVAAEKAKLFGSAQEKLSVINKELTAKIQAQNQMLKLYKDRIAVINDDIEKQKNKQSELTFKIDEANKKYKESVAQTGKNSEASKELNKELNDLKEKYAQNEKAIESSNKKLIDATTKMNNTEKAMLQNKKALEDIDKEISNVKLDKLAEGFEKVGDKAEAIGKKASLVSAGIVGGGVALGKVALDTEESLDTLQGRLGMTAEEAEALKEVAKGVYDDGFGESIDDTINSLISLESNLVSTKFWSDETKRATLEQIMTINKLFNTETEEITKTLAVMQNSGLTDDLTYALDVITVGFQRGGDYSGELLDSLREYSPQFVKLGLSAEEAMEYLITGAENGAFNLDKVGDAMKEFAIRAIDGSDTTADGFTRIGLNADEMASKFAAGGDTARDSFKQVIEAIAAMEDPVEQSIVGVNLFGTMWEDLGPQVITSLATVKGGLEGVEDATLKAGEQINNSFSTQMTISMREVKDSLMPLGVEVLSLAQLAFPKLQEIIKKVTEFLKGLDDNSKKNIVAIAGLVATIGPAVVMLGTFSKGIKSIINGYKSMKEFGSKAVEVVSNFGGKAVDAAKSAGSFALNLGKTALNLGKTAVQAGISAAQFVGHKVATIASTIATNTMAAAQATLNFIMSLNPITLVIAGLVALGATFVVLYNKCEWFRNGVQNVWGAITGTFQKFNGFLTSVFATDWTNSFGLFGNIMNAFFANMSNSWEAVKRVFSGIINFVSGVFTGDWSKAWSGVVNVFGGIMDGLGAVIKAPLNAVIGLINLAIEQLNKISFTAPSWVPGVGGKHFGVNLPKINYLYKGGIVTKPTFINWNTIAGDAFNGQGSKAEAVVPLTDMYRNISNIVNTAVEGKGKGVTQNFYIYSDDARGTKTAKTVKKAMRDLALGM